MSSGTTHQGERNEPSKNGWCPHTWTPRTSLLGGLEEVVYICTALLFSSPPFPQIPKIVLTALDSHLFLPPCHPPRPPITWTSSTPSFTVSFLFSLTLFLPTSSFYSIPSVITTRLYPPFFFHVICSCPKPSFNLFSLPPLILLLISFSFSLARLVLFLFRSLMYLIHMVVSYFNIFVMNDAICALCTKLKMVLYGYCMSPH